MAELAEKVSKDGEGDLQGIPTTCLPPSNPMPPVSLSYSTVLEFEFTFVFIFPFEFVILFVLLLKLLQHFVSRDPSL